MLLIGSVTIFVFIYIDHVILIVGLEDRLPVSNTSANSIVCAHYVPQLIKVLENMDTNASVETCRLKQP